jgi:hypothetical protein
VFSCGTQNLSDKMSNCAFLICLRVQDVIRTQTVARDTKAQARRKVDIQVSCSITVRNKVK